MTLAFVAPEHAAAIQHLAAHPDVIATTNLPDPYPENGALEWIRFATARRTAGKEYAFAMLDDDGAVVGVCGLMDVANGEAELGYWVGRPFWGRGHATAACTALAAFAFDTLSLRRLHACPLMRNRASRRVLEKAGFTLEGIRTNFYAKWHPLDYLATYYLTIEQWRTRSPKCEVRKSK